MSAQHPNILERLFGRKREPEHTPWQRVREEHKHQQQTDALALVALLRTPASHNPTRTNGLARAVRTPRITLPPFDTWIQLRMPELPAPRQPVSEPLKPTEDAMPPWARPNDASDEWLNSNVANLKVWTEPERQSTGAMEALAALAAQKQAMDDGDTLEVPAYMKQKHEKKESESA